MKELRAWRRAQRAMIDAYIPEAYESFPEGVLEQQFSDNEKRIKQEEAAAEAKKSKAEDKAPQGSSDASDDSAAETQAAPVFFAGESAEGADKPHEAQKGAAWQDMVKSFAGDHLPKVKNMSDHNAWTQAFVEKYAAAFTHYVKAQQEVQDLLRRAPSSADKCHSMKELRAWRRAQRAMIDAYIPEAYESFPEGVLEQQFSDNEKRIKQEEAAAEAKKSKADDAKEAKPKHAKADDAKVASGEAATKEAAPASGATSFLGAQVFAGPAMFAALGAVAVASALSAAAATRAISRPRPSGAFSAHLLAAEEPAEAV